MCLQLSGGPSSSPLGPHPYRNVQSGHAKWLTITTRHALVIGVGHREANVVQFEFQAPLSASLAHGPAVLNSATPAICAAIWPFRIARLRMWTIWACSFRIVLLHLRSIWTPLLGGTLGWAPMLSEVDHRHLVPWCCWRSFVGGPCRATGYTIGRVLVILG